MIPILIGALFLSERFITGVSIKQFILPSIIIGIGLVFILRPKNRHYRVGAFDNQDRMAQTAEDASITFDKDYTGDKRDFIDTTSIFGGIKKIVLSKNFKGGELVNFMGGSEINLTQADFSGRIRTETTNVFGGTKLVVPPTWDVQSEVVAIFGGVDDKRQLIGTGVDPNKVLIIEGTCIFGGIEIRSY